MSESRKHPAPAVASRDTSPAATATSPAAAAAPPASLVAHAPTPKNRRVGLYTKFAILFVAVAVVLLAFGTAWIRQLQEDQAQREMLETTRVLAHEMDAVWEFMETNQQQFKLGSDGTYNLYCVVAAKAVSRIFTRDSDYLIHYTNTQTRKKDDSPDDFEMKAIETLKADPSLEYYCGFDDYMDMRVFRYVEPVYITESCLECHGDPKGELDVKGYPKEGMQVGDIAGAASIIMPTDTFEETLHANIMQESALLCMVLVADLGVIFFGISRLVTRPIRKLQTAMNHVENSEFDEGLAGLSAGSTYNAGDEIAELSLHFETMATQLKSLYGNLSSQVESRTEQLLAANATLEEQRIRLEETNALLQEDNQYKTDFLSIMSHELRTPLTSVLAFGDLWASAYEPRDADEAKIVHEIATNSQVILGIVNNILEMARAEAGKAVLDLDMVDLFDLVHMVTESMQALAEKRHIRLLTSLDLDTPIINADGEKIRRILENLISNAIKFTAEGGTVEIATFYERDGGMVRLSVKDDGPGITSQDREAIFDSFIQGASPSGHIGGGSGLGLSVVRQLAELHGGRVDLVSEVGVGSEFMVWIPIGDNESGDLE